MYISKPRKIKLIKFAHIKLIYVKLHIQAGCKPVHIYFRNKIHVQ